MNAKIALLLVVFPAVILCLGFNPGCCVEEFPEWVPMEVIEKAKQNLSSTIAFISEIGSLYSKGNINKNYENCKIKYPHEVVLINYSNISEGENISKYFSPPYSTERCIGLGIYTKDKRVGQMYFDLKSDSIWQASKSGGFKAIHDGLRISFEKYPEDKGYKIYKVSWRRTYMAVKNEEVRHVVQWQGVKKGFVVLTPGEYMKYMKKRISEIKDLKNGEKND